MLTVKVTGKDAIPELMKRLRGALTQEAAESLLLVATEPTVQAVRANIGTGPEPVHLRDNIIAAPDRDYAKANGWLASVAIGATSVARIGRLFYDKFLEFGTIKRAPSPFLRPGHDSTVAAVKAKTASLLQALVAGLGRK